MLVSPEVDIWIAGIFGLLIGSFLNVVIHRVPKILERQWWTGTLEMLQDGDSYRRVFNVSLPSKLSDPLSAMTKAGESLPPLSLTTPRSRCPHCARAIRWYENIPLISYAVLRGQCAGCKAGISLRYPAVELVTGMLFAWVAWRWGITWSGAAWAFFAAMLVAQFMIDFDTQYLPDDLNYPLLWAGLLAAVTGVGSVALPDAVWGAALGYLSLWSVYHVYRLLTGKEGMGYGDFKLLAALGAWFGADYLIAIVLMSSVVGALLGGALLVVGKLANKNIPIAFGPFLCGAGLLLMVIGPPQFREIAPFVFPFR